MGFAWKKKIIYGCDEFGSGTEPYLTRYTFWKSEGLQLCLHIFHRSDDARALHDHPWGFTTLLLWGGYHEHTPKGSRRFLPGSILRRPAKWAHRVQLTKKRCNHIDHQLIRQGLLIRCEGCDGSGFVEATAVSLVAMGKREREWGFFTSNGWMHNRDYDVKFGCHTLKEVETQ